MQPPLGPSIPAPEQEPAELSLFREAWKAEVQKKKAVAVSPTTPSGAGPSTSIPTSLPPDPQTHSETNVQSQPSPSSQTIAGSPLPKASVPIRASGSALEIYRRAIHHEQRSELDDALQLYRQAFRMDPNVDKAYHKQEMLAAILAPKIAPSTGTGASTSASRKRLSGTDDGALDDLAKSLKVTLAVKNSGSGKDGVVTGTLASLLAEFPQNLAFEPEDEKQGTPLRTLPDELLVLILRKLDPTAIERFSAVSRKARVVSLDSAIWRELVISTYQPPQINDVESLDTVVNYYLSDFRRVYIEHPRVRMDGVYIAVCHYVRSGLSENSWVNISHLITYHRYLRFFPNGQVLSLLANEEWSPQQIIPLLKPALRMKGLSIGTWHLSGTTIYLSNLMDASGRFPVPSFITAPSSLTSSSLTSSTLSTATITPSTTTNNAARYVFSMTLDLRSRPLGRWNKLDIISYDSVNLETGDAMPVTLKHERPFWFSKVRSYAA